MAKNSESSTQLGEVLECRSAPFGFYRPLSSSPAICYHEAEKIAPEGGIVTTEERYLFDLDGYLVLRKVLPAEVLASMNDRIDHLETLSDETVAARNLIRKYQQDNVYAQVGPAPQQGLEDYSGNILPCGGPFEELIDWPSILPYLEEMISVPFRLDAASFMSRHGGGGFVFHHGYAEMLPYSEYAFEHDTFRCASVKISYALTEVGVEDGCFAVIPGSHKSHFRNPLVGQIPDPAHPLVRPLPCEAGDAVLFSEDLSHGAVENRGSKIRRTLFYSYAPAFQCTWGRLTEVAAGFETRANPRRLELVQGPAPFEDTAVSLSAS